ncbi:MAG: HD domain-containing protein [Chitinophagaceae bacterium]|nr:HD domain-containing protein [Chitinophagaceae bacterium]
MNLRERIQQDPIFEIITNAIDEEECFIIGGYVRDIFLNKGSKDIDLVCTENSIKIAENIAKQLGKDVHISIFKNFGTAQIKWKEYQLEIVTARKESYQKNSRKPTVEIGTLEDDQKRRDFTINALSISLQKKTLGEVIDPFNGIEDIQKKILKTPLDPNITFSDDPLRIMRAIRFASQLNFDISHETMNGIIHNKERLKIVSAERITEELNKIILSPQISLGFKLLYSAGVLQIIFPEMANLQGVEEVEGKGHKDNFYHTLKVVENISKVSDGIWLRWAALLHDIAKPLTKKFYPGIGWTFHGHEEKGARMVPKLFHRMRLPMDSKMQYVQKLVRLHLRPIALVKKEVTESAIRRLLFEAGEDIDDLMKLCKADITSKDHNKVQKYLANFQYVEQKIIEVEAKDHIRNFQPPISGEIIMQVYNLPPSKIIGEIKEAIKEAILEGIIQNNFHDAYNFMLTIAEQKKLTLVKPYNYS